MPSAWSPHNSSRANDFPATYLHPQVCRGAKEDALQCPAPMSTPYKRMTTGRQTQCARCQCVSELACIAKHPEQANDSCSRITNTRQQLKASSCPTPLIRTAIRGRKQTRTPPSFSATACLKNILPRCVVKCLIEVDTFARENKSHRQETFWNSWQSQAI